MTWRRSLVRIAGFNVDELRKRLSEVMDRREALDARMRALQAEREDETRKAEQDAEFGFYRLGYLQGWRARREALEVQIQVISQEEEGARDALTLAFEELKKYEHVEETARVEVRRLEARRETALLDEMGMRLAAKR